MPAPGIQEVTQDVQPVQQDVPTGTQQADVQGPFEIPRVPMRVQMELLEEGPPNLDVDSVGIFPFMIPNADPSVLSHRQAGLKGPRFLNEDSHPAFVVCNPDIEEQDPRGGKCKIDMIKFAHYLQNMTVSAYKLQQDMQILVWVGLGILNSWTLLDSSDSLSTRKERSYCPTRYMDAANYYTGAEYADNLSESHVPPEFAHEAVVAMCVQRGNKPSTHPHSVFMQTVQQQQHWESSFLSVHRIRPQRHVQFSSISIQKWHCMKKRVKERLQLDSKTCSMVSCERRRENSWSVQCRPGIRTTASSSGGQE